MNDEIFDLLDQLAARGRWLRQQMTGDVFPFGPNSPISDQLEEVWALFLARHMTREERPHDRTGR